AIEQPSSIVARKHVQDSCIPRQALPLHLRRRWFVEVDAHANQMATQKLDKGQPCSGGKFLCEKTLEVRKEDTAYPRGWEIDSRYGFYDPDKKLFKLLPVLSLRSRWVRQLPLL